MIDFKIGSRQRDTEEQSSKSMHAADTHGHDAAADGTVMNHNMPTGKSFPEEHQHHMRCNTSAAAAGSTEDSDTAEPSNTAADKNFSDSLNDATDGSTAPESADLEKDFGATSLHIQMVRPHSAVYTTFKICCISPTTLFHTPIHIIPTKICTFTHIFLPQIHFFFVE